MKVRITTTDGLLGTANADPEIYEKFIGGKLMETIKKSATEEQKKEAEEDYKKKIQEELETLNTEELVEKSMTVFHRNADGVPILYDYQVRGFIKEMIGIFVEFSPIVFGGRVSIVKGKDGKPKLDKEGKPKTEVKGGVTLSKYTFKRFVDNYIFVTPREIPIIIPEGIEITTCTRPLRGSTLKGDRIALGHSEEIAAGATCQFVVHWTEPKLEKLIRRAFDYGVNKGIGQWRNSGKGRFTWEEI